MGVHRAAWQSHWHRQLEQIESEGKRRRLREFVRQPDSAVDLEFNQGRVLNFGSNDYLNLACHEKVLEVIRNGLDKLGWGSGASPLVTGRSAAHSELEAALAEFEQTEAALVFSTGYAANVAAIITLVERGDGIFSDQLNHASLIDGCRLSGAEICRYRHVDVNDLADQLAAQRHRFARAIIVTDSLFSMDGDLAPLHEICDLAERFDCLVVADEAHATGIYSEKGQGWCHESGCSDRVMVRTGTLSKAIGGLGGFIVGPKSLIDLALHRGRSYMFSTAMPAVMAQAATCSLALLQEMGDERASLRGKACATRQQLKLQGWETGGIDSPIIPIYTGAEELCVDMASELMKQGLLVPAIRPPTVPKGRALLRISLSISHQDSHLQYLLEVLSQLRKRNESSVSVNHAIHARNA